MNSYKLTNVETQCLASHCSIKRSPIETQSIASLRMFFELVRSICPISPLKKT
ncbi:MAG: hypothetical protein LBB88_09230 [Planctomycetaceae bacterium]|nr:hypothetical protein [Planctomycetaceae bacterium]